MGTDTKLVSTAEASAAAASEASLQAPAAAAAEAEAPAVALLFFCTEVVRVGIFRCKEEDGGSCHDVVA